MHQFQECSLDVSSLIVTKSVFLKKERSKMRYLLSNLQIYETDGGQIKEQDVPLT